MMTPQGAYKTLRVLLRVFAVLVAVAGFVSILNTGWLLKTFLPNLGYEASNILLVGLKDFGALAFFIAYLVYVTSRDPLRYIAIIDALAVTVFLLAVIDVYSVMALNLGTYFPAGAIWARAVFRVAIGVALIVLRPRRGSPSAHVATDL